MQFNEASLTNPGAQTHAGAVHTRWHVDTSILVQLL